MDMYGKWLSDVGQAVSTVYGGDTTKYRTVCGVGTFFITQRRDERLNSTKYVADGGKPAKDYTTHIAVANYYHPGLFWSSAELLAATMYATADEATKAALLQNYVSSCTNDPGSYPYTLPVCARAYASWLSWARGIKPTMKMTAYEGGFSPDGLTANWSAQVSAISRGATTTITVRAMFTGTIIVPPAGSSVSFANVGGTTQLNGNTYTVMASSGNQFSINVDSRGFGAFTSDGAVTYAGSKDFVNAFRLASKQAAELRSITTKSYQDFVAAGGERPSEYSMAGNGDTWSVFDPDLWQPAPGRWLGIVDFNA